MNSTYPNTKKIVTIEFSDGINEQHYLDVIVPKSQIEGFNKFNNIPTKLGMLFYFPSRDISITSKDMQDDLYLIAVDEYKIISMTKLNAGTDLTELEGRYVIETSTDNPILEKIKVGDIVKFNTNKKQKMRKGGKKYKFTNEFGDEIKANTYTFLKFREKKATLEDFGASKKKTKTIKFRPGGIRKQNEAIIEASGQSKGYLLDDKARAQMSLSGDERIFSREHTKIITKLIKAKPTKETVLKLGTLLKDIVNKHNTQQQEYVKA